MKKYIYKYCIGLMILASAACSKDGASPSPSADMSSGGSGSGVGGSMARFTVAGDYLYTVDYNTLKVFDISNAAQPNFVNQTSVGTNIETIFARDKNTLFIGSENGMFIFSLDNPQTPRNLSVTQHIRSYDPVVANDKYAFVTLRSGVRGGVDELQVYDISNLQNAQLLATYPMSSPYGLGLRDNELFVCDAGLKHFDATDPLELQLKSTYEVQAYDVIPLPDNLLVIGDGGLYQYKEEGNALTLLSKIPVSGL